MARPLRTNRADGWYHVFHRGIERRAVYGDDRDRTHFLELLGEVHERFRVRIHAYCLMDNHWHGVLQTPDANLSQAMQWLHLSHAAWFNARHGRVGALWQGRFRARPVEDGAWAYGLSLYVHLNPVCTDVFGLAKRAKRVEGTGLKAPSKEEVTKRQQQLRAYRWSSYRAYGGYEASPEWLETETVLARACKEEAGRQRAYRAAARAVLSKGVDPSRRERLLDAVAVGSVGFVRQVKNVSGGGGRETAGKRELRRRVTFEEVVRAVEQLRGESWDRMVSRRGDAGRPLVMWAARRYSGMTLREVGAHVGGMDYAAVSIALKRFEQKAATSAPLAKAMAQLGEVLNVET